MYRITKNSIQADMSVLDRKNNLRSYRVKEETLTPKEYMQLYKKNKSNIEKTHIIPPSIGSNGSGKIHVRYKNPIFVYDKERGFKR